MPNAPYISKVNIGTVTYNIKDVWAREQIGSIGSPMHFKGRAKQTLTDGGNQKADAASGNGYTGATGDVYLQYQSGTATAANDHQEFVWTGSAWELLGDEGSYVTHGAYTVTLTPTTSIVTSTTSYQPAGTINTPSFSWADTNSTKSVSVNISLNTPTFDTVTSTGTYTPAGTVTKPSFTGTGATITVTSTKEFISDVESGTGQATLLAHTMSQPIFTGTSATITLTSTYTPAGSISIQNTTKDVIYGFDTPNFTTVLYTATVDSNETLSWSAVSVITAINPSTTAVIGTITGGTFSGTSATITVSGKYTPVGTISTPTLTWGNTTITITLPVSVAITPTKEKVTSTTTYTPAGSVSQPTFTGTGATITVTSTEEFIKEVDTTTSTYIILPNGTISRPTFTGTTATLTSTSTKQYMEGVTGSVTL